MMKLEDVLEFIKLCEVNQLTVWIDGGWGVDSLLCEQTREHADLDVAVYHHDVPKFREILESKGFKQIEKNDTTEYNFVLADEAGQEIDFHSFELNDDGSNRLGIAFIAKHLTGSGMIGDRAVKTIDPKWMIEFHTWYEPDENDYHDVKLLCEKFGVPIPEKYKKFEKK